jgi:hypothetical protein
MSVLAPATRVPVVLVRNIGIVTSSPGRTLPAPISRSGAAQAVPHKEIVRRRAITVLLPKTDFTTTTSIIL